MTQEREPVTVEAGNRLYAVQVPQALTRGMVVEWPEGRDAKFAIVGLSPDEIHGLCCQLLAQTYALAVAEHTAALRDAYDAGRARGRQEAYALPVMESDAA